MPSETKQDADEVRKLWATALHGSYEEFCEQLTLVVADTMNAAQPADAAVVERVRDALAQPSLNDASEARVLLPVGDGFEDFVKTGVTIADLRALLALARATTGTGEAEPVAWVPGTRAERLWSGTRPTQELAKAYMRDRCLDTDDLLPLYAASSPRPDLAALRENVLTCLRISDGEAAVLAAHVDRLIAGVPRPETEER